MIVNYNDNLKTTKKIVITTSRNSSSTTKSFVKVLNSLIPYSIRIPRGNLKLYQLYQLCYLRNFNVLIIIHEYQSKPSYFKYYRWFVLNILYQRTYCIFKIISTSLITYTQDMKTIIKRHTKKIKFCSGKKIISKGYLNNNYHIILQLLKIIFSSPVIQKNRFLFLYFYKNFINIRCYFNYHSNKITEVSTLITRLDRV